MQRNGAIEISLDSLESCPSRVDLRLAARVGSGVWRAFIILQIVPRHSSGTMLTHLLGRPDEARPGKELPESAGDDQNHSHA